MSITKAHLANYIHDKFGFPQNQSVQVIESILEIIKKTLENGVGWVKRQKDAGFRYFNIIYLTSRTCKLSRLAKPSELIPLSAGLNPLYELLNFSELLLTAQVEKLQTFNFPRLILTHS